MGNEAEVTEIVEEVKEEIAETVEEIAAEIIEERDDEIKELEAINKSIIDAMINSEEYRQRMEFENRVWDAINEIRDGLEKCQNNLETLRSQTNNSLATAETASAIAEVALETSLIPEMLNQQNDHVDVPGNQTPEIISPENPPSPQPPAPQNLRKRIRRLL